MFGGFHERFWKACLPLHTLIPLAFEKALHNPIVFQPAQGTGRVHDAPPWFTGSKGGAKQGILTPRQLLGTSWLPTGALLLLA